MKSPVLIVIVVLLGFIEICAIGYVYSFPHGLQETCYPNTEWQGTPCNQGVTKTDFSRPDLMLQAAACSTSSLSIKWTGYFSAPETSDYLFLLTCFDSDVWLNIDGITVLAPEDEPTRSEQEGTITLPKGLHRIQLRYSQKESKAGFSLAWKKNIAYYHGKRPLRPDLLFPPHTNLLRFRVYSAANAALPLFTLIWLILIAAFGINRFYPGFFSRRMARAITSIQKTPRRLKIHFALSFCVLTAAIYCSTGTLAPYANTLNLDYPGYPTVEPQCQYLYNGDYGHFEALFLLLDGAPPDAWNFSLLHRRILYNILAYPFMKLLGHDTGGIVTNMLLSWIAFTTCMVFLLRNTGEHGTKAGMWLFALYPGITYYAGQPFLYAIIVPGSIWLYMLLWQLEKSSSRMAVGLISLGMGILFTGYDFIIFFGGAAIVVLFLRKKWLEIPLATAGIIFPSLVWLGILRLYYGVALRNSNTTVYSTILKSYFLSKDVDKWLELLKELPQIATANFFFSCFFFLPCLFVGVLALSLLLKHHQWSLSEIAIAGNILLVFLFNNLAPPYESWQMRGDWMPRLYQPVFVVFLMYVARTYQRIMSNQKSIFVKWVVHGMLLLSLIGNGVVIFGPVLNDPWHLSAQIYWRYYKHSGPDSMNINLERYGRRPLGFCRHQT